MVCHQHAEILEIGFRSGKALLAMLQIVPQQQPIDAPIDPFSSATKIYLFLGSGVDAPLMALRKLFKDKSHLVTYVNLDWNVLSCLNWDVFVEPIKCCKAPLLSMSSIFLR